MTTGGINKLGLGALIAMCVGPMIGSGIFNLPQDIAGVTGVLAMLIAWVITFFGMFCLAKVFQNLVVRRPDLDAGIYAYAREGLGDYLGFSSAWGYWVSVWVGNVAYLIILCASLSLFFPTFSDGTSLTALIFSSISIWVVAYLCSIGIRSAAFINMVTTVAKVIPILIFIVLTALAFNIGTFSFDIWQVKLGSIPEQVKNMMLITVWIFIGIEGASVLSARAKDRHDVGRATLISFILVFLVLFLVSILPFGILSQQELVDLNKPAIGSILARVSGGWANVLMNIGLMVSILGAFLAWVLIAAEVPHVAGKVDRLFPKVFTKENKVGSPVGALFITALAEQLYLIFVYFYHAGYNTTISIAAAVVLPPYLFSALYALVLAISGKTYNTGARKERHQDAVVSSIAVIYGVWLLYAAGGYLLFSSLLYLVGSIMYVVHRRCNGQKLAFSRYDILAFLSLVVLGSICVFKLVTEGIKI